MKVKKWISILISISIIFSLASSIVVADGESMSWSDLKEAFSTGGTINLQSGYVVAGDSDESLIISSDTKVTLNMNTGTGIIRNVESPSSTGNAIIVHGELEINVSGEGSAMIVGGYSAGFGGGIYIGEDAKVTINGRLLITGCKAESDGGGIFVENGGELIMNGGVVSNCTTYGEGNHGGGIYVSSKASFSVSGKVSINGAQYDSPDASSYVSSSVYLAENARINVTGDLTGSSIGVDISNSHDGVITSNFAQYNSSSFNGFHCDDAYRYSLKTTGAGEFALEERVYHTISVWGEDHGTVTFSGKTEFEVGEPVYMDVQAEDGYCLTSLRDIETNDPVPVIRYYQQTDRYCISPMPDRDVILEAEWTPIKDTVIIKTTNLTLLGQIRLNFKLKIPDALANDPNAKVLISHYGATRQVALSSLSREGELYVVSQACAPRQFNTPVDIKVTDGSGKVWPLTTEKTKAQCINQEAEYKWINGKYDTTGENLNNLNEFTYTVHKYANDQQIKGRADSNKLKKLMEGLQHYSLSVWYYFDLVNGQNDHNFGEYAEFNSYRNRLDRVSEQSLAGYAPSYPSDITGLHAEGMYLTFDSDTTINIHYSLKPGYSLEDYSFSCAGHDLVIEKDGDSSFIVKIKGIVAKDLDHKFSVVATKGSETMTVECCALSYAYLVFHAPDSALSQDKRDKLCDVARAMKIYSDAANAYFES